MKKGLIINIKGANGDLKIRRTLFWDLNVNEITAERNIKIIIERVLTRGTITEFSQIIRYYNVNTIKQIIVNLASLDKKTLNFASQLFKINKSEFLCYRKNQ